MQTALIMDKTFTIRLLNEADIPALVNLLKLNTPAYFSPEEEIDFIRYLNYETDYYYVLEVHQILIGCGGINFSKDKQIAKLSWDVIHPAFQGQSFGTSLLRHRMNELKKMNHFGPIIVRTSQFSFKFYQKLGFKLIEVISDYWAPGFDLYYMKFDDAYHE